MAELTWVYEKLDEDGKIKRLPQNDSKGEITGKFIIGLPEYFDEHPEERKRLGWIKHIVHKPGEVVEYDAQTQYLVKSTRVVDDYTVEDVYIPVEKSEEMLLFEEMYETLISGQGFTGIFFR